MLSFYIPDGVLAAVAARNQFRFAKVPVSPMRRKRSSEADRILGRAEGCCMKYLIVFVTLGLTALVCVLFYRGAGSHSSPHSITSKEVLDWLPPETRTVMVSVQPGKTDRSPENASTGLAALLPRMPQVGLPGGMPTFAYNFYVHGAYGNRPAKNLGLLPFSGCDVASIEPAASEAIEEYLKKDSTKRRSVHGLETYVLEENQGGTPWTHFALVKDGLFICATDESYLSSLLDRREKHVAASIDLGEKSGIALNLDSPFWAFHRMADKQEAAAEVQDPAVTEVAVYLSKDKRQVGVVYSSSSKVSYDRLKTWWAGYLKQEGAPLPKQYERLSPSLTRIVLDAQARKGEVATLALLVALGHPVLI
ncbi:MAG TPA: hypothetical protein VG944_19440 [Fimbriimonas sp.]|nr:hypothetical protein [Fimbriimonas sp.]